MSPKTRQDSEGSQKNAGLLALQEESKESQRINPVSNSLHDKSNVSNNVQYGYDRNAMFSIDGERYPAQRLQGRVLKQAMPIYC